MWIVGAIFIGVTLGLMGSGGSILTVPVLVYLVGEDKDVAVAESLAIVGLIALTSTIPNAISKLIDWKCVLFFGAPGMLGTLFGAWLGASVITGTTKLLLFAGIMLLASWTMFSKRPVPKSSTLSKNGDGTDSKPSLLGDLKVGKLFNFGIKGFAVGIVTGVVGVGGGFLIVPALATLTGLKIREAIATSLFIITMNSCVGFTKYSLTFRETDLAINWTTILIFALVGAVGSLLGRQIGKKLEQNTLRRLFGTLLILMSAFIFWQEAPKAFGYGETQESQASETNSNLTATTDSVRDSAD